jgi:hypothetical protein
VNGKVFLVGIIALVVALVGGLGGQVAGFLQNGYGNCGNCNNSDVPNPGGLALPLDVAYVLLAIGIVGVIAGLMMESPKLDAT